MRFENDNPSRPWHRRLRHHWSQAKQKDLDEGQDSLRLRRQATEHSLAPTLPVCIARPPAVPTFGRRAHRLVIANRFEPSREHSCPALAIKVAGGSHERTESRVRRVGHHAGVRNRNGRLLHPRLKPCLQKPWHWLCCFRLATP